MPLLIQTVTGYGLTMKKVAGELMMAEKTVGQYMSIR